MKLAPRTRRHGVSLIEVLLALTISATLLAAVAIAVNACFESFRVNQERGIVLNRARSVMLNLVQRMRMTEYLQPRTPGQLTAFQNYSLATTAGVTDNGIQILASDVANDGTSGTRALTDIAYYHDTADNNKRLQIIVNGKTWTLLDGVTDFRITFHPKRSSDAFAAGGGCDVVDYATITMTVVPIKGALTSSEMHHNPVPADDPNANINPNAAITLTASIVPRKSSWSGRTTPFAIEDMLDAN